MAGSLSHIVNQDGSFTADEIENLGDAIEALEECHSIIAWLLPFAGRAIDNTDAKGALVQACHELNLEVPHTPVLHGRKT